MLPSDLPESPWWTHKSDDNIDGQFTRIKAPIFNVVAQYLLENDDLKFFWIKKPGILNADYWKLPTPAFEG